MRRLLCLILALFAFGCATPRQPSYVFSVPLPRPEEWTQVYPGSRDRDPLKFLLLNDATGARIAFFSHASLYRDPASVAGELKVRFAQDGYVPGEIAAPVPGGPAGFRMRDPKRDESGQVVVFRPARVRACIVAIGRWPSANDGPALADMDLVMAHIDAWPED